MSDYRRLGYKSGGLLWTPLSQLWQVGTRDRAYRDPKIQSLAISDERPFQNPSSQVANPRFIGSVFTAPNLVVRIAAPPLVPALSATALLVKDSRFTGDVFTAPNLVVRIAAAPPLVPALSATALLVKDHRRINVPNVFSTPNLLRTDNVVVRAPTYAQRQVPRPQVFVRQQDNIVGTLLVDVTVLRAPTYAQRHIPWQLYLTQTSNTLVTLLAAVVAPPPFVPAPHLGPLRASWQPRDASAGTAKTLIADAVAPFFVAPAFAPLLSWFQPADSTRSTPKTLVADAVAPFFVAPAFAPLHRWFQPADSTRSTPKALVADAVAPFFVAPAFAPLHRWFQPADSTRSTPKVLVADAQAPFFVAPHYPQLQHKYEWLPADTSQSTPVEDRVAPFVPAPHLGPLRASWQPQHFNYGTPKGLLEDGQLPFFVAPHYPQLQHKYEWLPADTSQGVPSAFRDLPPPFVPAPHLGPLRASWQPQHFNYGTPKGLLEDGQLPFFVAPYFASLNVRQIAVSLVPNLPVSTLDVSAPFITPLHIAPVRLSTLADTSEGTPKPLIADATPAFVPVLHLLPIKRQWQPVDLSYGTAKPLIADAQAPFISDALLPPVYRRQSYGDTTAGTRFALFEAPFVTVIHVSTQFFRLQSADTSFATSASLIAAAAAAPFIPSVQSLLPKKPWLPQDATRGSAKTLLEEAELPIHADAWIATSAPQRVLQVIAIQSPNLTATTLAQVAPFIPALQLSPVRRVWQPLDASTASAKALIAFQPAWAAAVNIVISSGARVA